MVSFHQLEVYKMLMKYYIIKGLNFPKRKKLLALVTDITQIQFYLFII